MNHYDYKIWKTTQQRSENDSRRQRTEAVTEKFHRMQRQIVIDEAIDEWRKVMTSCIYTGVGRFEHFITGRCASISVTQGRHVAPMGEGVKLSDVNND